MKNTKKIRSIGVAALVLLWAVLVGFSWFGPRTEVSEAERRPWPRCRKFL